MWQLVPHDRRKYFLLTYFKSKISKWFCHDAHDISLRDFLITFVISTRIDFPVSTCRFINYIFTSRTILTIVTGNKFLST